jgi:tRNA threonylcarbamoyladenosine biosynthesis protein TsaB
LLDQTGWQATAIDAVAVASGPGSFTSLRVGVTAAKMLAFVAGCGVVEVDTLAVLAAQAGNRKQPVWAVLDAQRNELFAARFNAENLTPPTEILPVEIWLAKLQPGEMVIGPVLEKLRPELPAGVLVAPEESWTPDAQTVVQLALPAALAGEFISPEQLLPRYHRLSAAEEKRLKTDQEAGG